MPRPLLIVSGTTLLRDSGTTARLETTIRASARVSPRPIVILGFESARLLVDPRAVFRRFRRFREIGCWFVPLPLYPQSGKGGRMLMTSIMAVFVAAASRALRPEYCIAVNADAGSSLRWVQRDVPRLLELHGIETLEWVAPSEAAMRARRAVERTAVAGADAIIAPTESGRSVVMEEHGFADTPPWFALPTISEPSSNASRAEARKRHLVYVGGLQPWQRVTDALDTLVELRRLAPWTMDLLTPDVDQAKALVSERGLVDAVTVDRVAPAEIHARIGGATLGLLLRDELPMNRFAWPTKFADYLHAGVPVLVTSALPDCAQIARQCGVGLIVESTAGPPGIAAAISEWAELADPELPSRCVETGKDRLGLDRAIEVYESVAELLSFDRAERVTSGCR